MFCGSTLEKSVHPHQSNSDLKPKTGLWMKLLCLSSTQVTVSSISVIDDDYANSVRDYNIIHEHF